MYFRPVLAWICSLAIATFSCGSPDELNDAMGRSGSSSGGSGNTAGGQNPGAGGAGGASGGTNPTSSGGTSGGSTTGGAPGMVGETGPMGFIAVPAKEAIGLEWRPVAGAEHYNIYWSTEPGVSPATGTKMEGVQRNVIHNDLSDGTTYYYVVTAVGGGVESGPSAEVSAEPGGAYGLEFFGNGDMADLTGDGVPWVSIEKRLQVLILGDGYLANELDGYAEDVGEYIDEIFSLPIYASFAESMIVWSMPVASAERLGGNTAFGITAEPRAGSDTAARIWAAADGLPYPPEELYGDSSARNLVVGMMAANNGNSSYSGYMTTMRDPSSSRRLRVGFFHSRSHEISHAIGFLADEYYETTHTSSSSSETNNVFNSAQCDALPWKHLLFGAEYNPGVDQLVGAFGERVGAPGDLTRVHPEFKCHMNGSHDNAQIYGGSNNLRVSRMCNWCNELIAFRLYQRTGLLETDQSGFATWKADYRAGFYDVFGFKTPDPVPQENSVGESKFDACAP